MVQKPLETRRNEPANSELWRQRAHILSDVVDHGDAILRVATGVLPYNDEVIFAGC